MDHKIRFGGSKKAGWTWECSCGEGDGVLYADAFDRSCWAKIHLNEVRTVMGATCDRDHADEWVEVDNWPNLPEGTRMRQEWELGVISSVRYFVRRDDLPDPDTEAVDALRKASWNVPRLAGVSRPDPLPGLPEARDLLIALREAGFDVVRKEEG